MPEDDFPPAEQAVEHPNGLLAAGGEVTADSLIRAYRQGIFPWSMPDEPLMWWSPDPRGVIYPTDFQPSRSLRQQRRKQPWRFSVNEDFAGVMRACAEPRADQDGTWIDERIIAGYVQLHRRGLAHSVEVWLGDALVGGLYGVSLGRLFCGESMFSRQTDASKAAFWALMTLMQAWHIELVDCQMLNPHLERLGAVALSRAEYLAYVKQQVSMPNLIWSMAPTLLNSAGFCTDTR